MNTKKERPTVHDIARALNVTASTVSRALNDHPRISERTKIAVADMAKKLSYQPHRIAAALRKGRTHIIGVVVPMADRNFFASIVRGIEEMANHAHYQVMICQTYDNPGKEASAIEALLNSQVDGIIASFSKRTENFEPFLKVKAKGIPLIMFDRSHEPLGVSHVVVDDYLGAYKAVEHLVHQGCRRIAHFTNIQKINIYRDRQRGYQAALEDNGLAYDPNLVIESNLQLSDGRQSMLGLLASPECPDAVFSSSDLGAMGALQVLKENNISVPGRIALVGFSNEPFTMFSDPPLTSVDQHSMRMGNIASEIFLEEIKASPLNKFIPRKIVLNPELIVRQSSLKANETLHFL